VAVAATCLLLWGASSAWAMTTAAPRSPNVYKFGGDVQVPPDDVVGTVLLFGGDLTVAGRVQGSVVIIGGSVHVLSTGVVARTVLCLGGQVRRDPGASVLGNVIALQGSHVLGRVGSSLYRTVKSPFRPGSLLGWAATTVLYMVVAGVAAWLFSRQTITVRERIAQQWPASLGWGALSAVLVVPAISVLLLISVIGVLVLIPWLLVAVPVALFFGFACAGALVGRRLLSYLGLRRERLVASAVVGVVALHVLRLVPYAGSVVWALVWITGFGAVAIEVYLWGRARRTARRLPASPSQGTGTAA
jgi:hypothetical protein